MYNFYFVIHINIFLQRNDMIKIYGKQAKIIIKSKEYIDNFLVNKWSNNCMFLLNKCKKTENTKKFDIQRK